MRRTLITLIALAFSNPGYALVGKTNGSFAVSQGAATYSIPIATPQGINGLTPQITLNYNSKSGNGMMGIGWNLGGFSAITRCGQSRVIDGAVRAVQLDTGDRFCFSGQRLILVSGSYGKSGSEYRTEIDSYQKITAHGQAGNGPAWFKVHTKSGEIFEYGNTNSSRVEAQGKSTALSWLVNRISDRFNNQINFSYSERNQYSESVPTRIAYSLGGSYQVDIYFRYADLNRKLVPDKKLNYINGSRVNQSRYLTEVEVSVDGNIHRQYKPTYKHRHEDDLFPLLTSIEECTRSVCLPPIQFSWDEQKPLSATPANKLIKNIHPPNWGKPIIIRDQNGKTIWSQSQNGPLGPSAWYDFNNDGAEDLYFNKSFYLNVADNRLKDYGKTLLVDYNRDGAIDRLTAKSKWDFTIEPQKTSSDLIVDINNYGTQTAINYMDGALDTANHYTEEPIYDYDYYGRKNTNAITQPGFLVRSITISDGIGQSQTNYRYSAGWIHTNLNRHLATNNRLPGNFRKIEQTNVQTGTRQITEYDQYWPQTGRPKRIRSWQHDQLLSDTTIEYAFRTAPRYRGANSVYTVWPARKQQHNYSPEGAHLSTIITETAAPDSFGNITNISVETRDHVNDLTWQVDTSNQYQNTASTWVLGRLTQAHVTSKKTGFPDITKTAQFRYNDQGILTQEITEPNSNSLYKSVSYQYDAQGHKSAITTTAKDHNNQNSNRTITRSTSFVHFQGQAARRVVITNPLGHTETRYYSLKHGKLLAQTGPNRLSTRWQYDDLGRKTRQTRADGSWTTWRYELSDWSLAEYKNTQRSSGSAPIISYYDVRGRKLRTITTAVDGRQVFTDTHYDALGNKVFISRPYFSGDTLYGATLHYDNFSRLIRQDQPHTYGQIKQTFYDYGPFSNTVTNPLGHQKTTYSDAKGKTIKTLQEGAVISHEYDALNRLIATNNAKHQRTTIGYDKRGRKITMNDPVMGTWNYAYDGFDNLVRQTDAKGQVIHTEYDLLNRKTRQNVSGGDATWSYDNASGKGIGKLHRETAPLGFGRNYSYDALGRVASVDTHWQGQSYVTSNQYDSLSRIAAISHPNNIDVQNLYGEHGHLIAIRTPKNQVLDYDAQFIIKQLAKAEQFAALIEIDIEKYQQRAELYQRIADTYYTSSYQGINWNLYNTQGIITNTTTYYDISHYREKLQQAEDAINQLEQMAQDIQYKLGSIEISAFIYRLRIRDYKSWLYTNYGDAWTKGADYFEAMAELEYLKAQKYLQSAEENLKIIQAFEHLQNQINANTTGLYRTGPYGWWHSGNYRQTNQVNQSAYDLAVSTLKTFQQKAQESIRNASSLQQKQTNFLALLGSNARDGEYLTWYRIAQSDSEGRISQALYGNGLFTSWDYDDASGQLLSIQTGNMVIGNSNDRQYLAFQYDELNNLTQKDDYRLNRSESMSYDRMQRIINHHAVAAVKSWNHSYSYNDHGDLLYAPAGQYLYGDTATQQGLLLSVNDQPLYYDANGNITQAVNNTNISYNLNNKPILFEKGPNRTGFSYDGNGNRFLKTINGVASIYIGKLYEKNLTSGAEINHIYFGNQHIASYQKNANGSAQTSYMHKDALGNIDVLTNQHGDVLKRYVYEAFGKRHELSTNMSDAVEGKQSGVNLLRNSSDFSKWQKTYGYYSKFALSKVSELGGPFNQGYYRMTSKYPLERDEGIMSAIALPTLQKSGSHWFTLSVWMRSSNGQNQTMYAGVRRHSILYKQAMNLTSQWQRFDFSFGFSNLYNASTDYSRAQSLTLQISGNHEFHVEIAGAMLTPGMTPANWHATNGGSDGTGYTYTKPMVDRGYTGHEHFQVGEDASAGFIHMNGRVYDQHLGRFLSADPHIQAPNHSQSHNRYAYVLNNPYKYTDPSGYFFSKVFNYVKRVMKHNIGQVNQWLNKNQKAIITTAAIVGIGVATGGWGLTAFGGGFWGAVAAGGVTGFATGFAGTLMTGGSLEMAFQNGLYGAVVGAATAGLFNRIGTAAGQMGWTGTWRHSALQGVGGGISRRAQGGDFWQGFISQGLTHYTGSVYKMNRLMGDSLEGTTAMSAALGGTISSLSGGSFQNGAMTAAFANLYNDWGHITHMHRYPDGKYGNYTGTGHYEDHIYPNPADSPHLPMDALDAAARQHDIDYYNNGIKWSLFHSNPVRLAADMRFLNAINAIPSDQLSFYQRVYRLGANLALGVHVYAHTPLSVR